MGRTVSGAERFRPCSFRFHHLTDRETNKSSHHQTWRISRMHYPLLWHVPWFVYYDVLLTQEALLDHPLVTQELGPRGGKKRTEPTPRSELKRSHLTTKELTAQPKFPLFSHVVADGVGQDDHAALALLQLLGDVYCRGHGCPRAASCDRAEQTVSGLQAHIRGVRPHSFSRTLPQSRPSSLISMRDMLKDSSSSDLYQVSIT